MTSIVSRAQPLLGTLVVIRIACDAGVDSDDVIQPAFDAIREIHTVMSAHNSQSDLARLSRCASAQVLKVHPWTYEVLQQAQYWYQTSCGAFDPCRAAQQLYRTRPGLTRLTLGRLSDLRFLDAPRIQVANPLMLDLGGIAKGFAVDQAVEILKQHGIRSGIVEAGGDLRAWGDIAWRCDIRHANNDLRDRSLHSLSMRHLKRIQQGALATSVGQPINPEFISRRRPSLWRSVTIQAPDCVSADALTKWALQSSRLCPALQQSLRHHRARMWRTS